MHGQPEFSGVGCSPHPLPISDCHLFYLCKVTSPPRGWAGCRLGLAPVTWSPTAPVSWFLSSNTCHLLHREPTPSLFLRLCLFLDVGMNYQINVGKFWESTDNMLCLALPTNLEQILGKNPAVATPLSIQTQYTKLFKSRKCLSTRNRVELTAAFFSLAA